MTEALSPAAQAAVDAWVSARRNQTRTAGRYKALAAFCRAVADQVVPDGPKPTADSAFHLQHWTQNMDKYYQRQQTRAELLAIAAELEGQS